MSTALDELSLRVPDAALPGSLEEPGPPTGLASLPPGVLWHIARRAGLRARRACRALKDAYGPLDCSLRVDATDSAAELQQLLAHSCKGLIRIRALELPLPVKFDLAGWEGVLQSVCELFPRLEALSWWAGRKLPQGGLELAQLAPLGSSLTALRITMEDRGPDPQSSPLQGLQALARLRSLSLGCVLPDGVLVRGWLEALGGLPHLRAFTWVEDVGGNLPGEVVTGLAHALGPQLTSLALGARELVAVKWDMESAAALHHGFPQLERLSFRLLDVDRPICLGPAVSAALADALARRRCLSSLQLAVCLDAHSTIVEQLPRLQLSGLAVSDVGGLSAQQAAAFWRTVASQTSLTRLTVGFSFRALPGLAYPPIRAIGGGLVELQLLGWDPSRLQGCLTGLTRLTRLCLVRQALDALPAAAVQALRALTRLRHLDISEELLPPDILRSVACLSRLRELRLQQTWPQPGGGDLARRAAAEGRGFSGADLGHLAALRAHLTRLDLSGFGRAVGRGLSVLSELAHVQRVCLGAMWAVEGAGWPLHLLPLPASLCRLEVASAAVSQQAFDALLLAAAQQGCRVVADDVRLGRCREVHEFDSWAPAGSDGSS